MYRGRWYLNSRDLGYTWQSCPQLCYQSVGIPEPPREFLSFSFLVVNCTIAGQVVDFGYVAIEGASAWAVYCACATFDIPDLPPFFWLDFGYSALEVRTMRFICAIQRRICPICPRSFFSHSVLLRALCSCFHFSAISRTERQKFPFPLPRILLLSKIQYSLLFRVVLGEMSCRTWVFKMISGSYQPVCY